MNIFMVSFSPEPLFHIGAFPFTNTLLATILVDAVLISTAYTIHKHISYIPTSKIQNIGEIIIEGFYGVIEPISPKNVNRILPYVTTFFLFILIANWMGLLPGFGSFGFYEMHEGQRELVPFLRGATSDINLTLGLALVSIVATHAMSISVLGIKEYLGKFFSLNPIFLFVGILELVGELTKIVSLSFRLFGNIYAGEVVLHTISGMFAFIAPLPFLTLEIIVGVVQALVFAMLTMAFMAILTTSHHAEHDTKEVNH